MVTALLLSACGPTPEPTTALATSPTHAAAADPTQAPAPSGLSGQLQSAGSTTVQPLADIARIALLALGRIDLSAPCPAPSSTA
jgi:ABC-type phosphate transport system substrate-binding protein